MALNNYSTAARNALADALVDLIDAGAGANGTIEYLASDDTVLAILDFSATAFGAAAAGVATANAIAQEDSAPATGNATKFKAKDTDGNVVWEGTVNTTAGDPTADIIVDGIAITTADVVAMTSWTITAPT